MCPGLLEIVYEATALGPESVRTLDPPRKVNLIRTQHYSSKATIVSSCLDVGVSAIRFGGVMSGSSAATSRHS